MQPVQQRLPAAPPTNQRPSTAKAGETTDEEDFERAMQEAIVTALQDFVSEEEASLVVPSGFSIRLDPPSIEALTFMGKPASAASIALVGWRVMRRYD